MQQSDRAAGPSASRARVSGTAASLSRLHAVAPHRQAPHSALQLQRTIGNQAVLRQITPGRPVAGTPVLGVSAEHDPSEIEADRMAARALAQSGAASGGDDGDRSATFPRQAARSGGSRSGAPGGAGLLTPGSGRPLDPAIRAFFEPRFQHDFSGVRIHTGAPAGESSDAVNARAYSIGRHVVFGTGEYAPDSADGRHLLAHELAHVVQQQRSASPPGIWIHRKAKAIRFRNEPTLDDISEGKKILAEGDKGEAVIRITTALSELGHYKISVIDENFDPPLTSAVTSYQTSKPALTGKAPVGKVDKRTFGELDKDFSAAYKVERDVVSKQTSADLLKGTDKLTSDERAATKRAISTETPVNPLTGTLPTFKPDLPGGKNYEKRLTKIVEAEIVAEYNAMGKDKAAAHADPAKLYDWTQIEVIAKESQKAVDAVFGEYYKGAPKPALTKGVNIFDAWDDKVATLTAGGTAAEDDAVEWRVVKIITGEPAVETLDRQHGAVQTRPAEKAIIDRVTLAMTTKHRAKLLETHKGWPGYADPDTKRIFIQLFKASSPLQRRKDMWEYYQTFIHEYLHTLEDSAHKTFRGTMTEQKGNKALREGVTDYFTKIVWNSIKIDDVLRATIEGPFHDPKVKTPIPALNTYHEANNAERLAGVVGVRNVMAAFFLGKVELIGKP